MLVKGPDSKSFRFKALRDTIKLREPPRFARYTGQSAAKLTLVNEHKQFTRESRVQRLNDGGEEMQAPDRIDESLRYSLVLLETKGP